MPSRYLARLSPFHAPLRIRAKTLGFGHRVELQLMLNTEVFEAGSMALVGAVWSDTAVVGKLGSVFSEWCFQGNHPLSVEAPWELGGLVVAEVKGNHPITKSPHPVQPRGDCDAIRHRLRVKTFFVHG